MEMSIADVQTNDGSLRLVVLPEKSRSLEDVRGLVMD